MLICEDFGGDYSTVACLMIFPHKPVQYSFITTVLPAAAL